ncbi:MAG: hypothetical protein PVI86_05525 [Phycisphaerae bacterium]
MNKTRRRHSPSNHGRVVGTSLGLALVLTSWTYGQPRADREAEPHPFPKIVPWIELNTSRASAMNRTVEGLRAWHADPELAIDTAIVSTTPGHEGIYTELRRRVPGMRIIPGMKTWTILQRFDSVEGWREVSRHVAAALAESHEHELLLDNETAIKKYRRGEYDIDLRHLREGLRLLPRDIKYIWYPSIHGSGDAVQERFAVVCGVAAEVLDVRFTDRSVHGPQALGDSWLKKAQERLDRFSEAPSIPIIYCYGDDRWWPDARIPDALEQTDKPLVILYPGAKRWTEAALKITEVLSEARAKSER